MKKEQLKEEGSKYRVIGTSISMISNGISIGDTVTLTNNDGSSNPGFKTDKDGGYSFIWCRFLEPLTKDLMTVVAGDYLVSDGEDFEREVVTTFEYDDSTYYVTRDTDDNAMEVSTFEELEDDNWEYKDTSVKEMTLEEISKTLGYTVKVIE